MADGLSKVLRAAEQSKAKRREFKTRARALLTQLNKLRDDVADEYERLDNLDADYDDWNNTKGEVELTKAFTEIEVYEVDLDDVSQMLNTKLDDWK